MRVAVVGCCHGELELMYQKVLETAKSKNCKVDLVLVAGDFQAIRNDVDLHSMSVPDKYLRYGDFREYYTGAKKAPVLTIFIGGNHEASNYMRHLYYGGWVCPNIYYLGSSGVIKFSGLRIAGISGIYSKYDYNRGYFEQLPPKNRDKKTIYHYRSFDVWKLSQIKTPIQVFLSHDWPADIWENKLDELLKMKPFLRTEIERGEFGSPPLAELLTKLSPKNWIAAHMHCKFSARIGCTEFLALDKCVRGRQFIDILNFKDFDEPNRLFYDEEWIDIIRKSQDGISYTNIEIGPDFTLPEKVETLESVDFGVEGLGQNLNSEIAVRDHYANFLRKFFLKNPFPF